MRVYHFLGYACRWGQNAETMSASPQLVANGGDPEWLFSEAIIQSGTLFPVEDVTPGKSIMTTWFYEPRAFIRRTR